MPELMADLFLSVDGSAAGSRSPGYFGFDGPELERWISDEMDRPHRCVMGRKTYALLSSLPEEARDDGWERMARTPTVVFSRTLHEASWPGATINGNDLLDEIPALKASSDVDLRTVGSLSLVRQLLDAGHLDRLRLMVFPLIIGETGRENFFTGLGDTALELVSQTVLDRRIVLLDYRPAGTPPYAG
jgi:dihydrofolate reductase